MTKKPANQASLKKTFFQKRIPTLIGLGILIIALVAGTLLFKQGTGVFAPRATPQTTPKKIKITNITESGFTISFLTDEATVGLIKYGVEAKKLTSQASDDRDQLSGTIKKFKVHHITLRALKPNTAYYYTLGTGSGKFDNNGQPFMTKTYQRGGVPTAAKTIYGSVTTPTGQPAEGSIVYVQAPNAGEMSSLVKNSGSWAIPLSNARLRDGSDYAQITDETNLTILAQGAGNNLVSQLDVLVAQAQPVPSITLGESKKIAAAATPAPTTPPPAATPLPTPAATPPAPNEPPSNDLATIASQAATPTPNLDQGGLSNLVEAQALQTETASSAAVIVDLAESEAASTSPTIDSGQPKIIGQAAPNVTISIQVNSNTQIDQYLTADAEGNFELDLAALGQKLEPGEHTVTYSYSDPETGETITKTQTFYVADTSSQIAQADTSTNDEANLGGTYPYSSSNPYPVGTQSAQATDSGEVATDAGQINPATQSSLPVSGAVGTTYALILGGLFFILAGVWSWWIANNLAVVEVKEK